VTAPRVVVVGGHVEPMMNLADALRRLEPTTEITALASTPIPTRGHPLELIPPLPRDPNRGARASVPAAGAVLDRVRAEVVVGFGGDVAMPAYLAAHGRGLPIVVHESDVQPGAANQLAARMTRHVFTASPGVRLPHATAIGIPLRPAITNLDRSALRDTARQRFGLRPDGPVLMATGGPHGAHTINAAVSGAAVALRANGVQVLHITGLRHVVRVPDGDLPYVVIPYVEEMQYAYAAADFVLCRSGAVMCAELAAVGLPAAYVPLPQRGGEQWLNDAEPVAATGGGMLVAGDAGSVVAAGGGLFVGRAELSSAWIETVLIPVLTDPERLAAMSAHAWAVGASDADVALAKHVLAVVVERRALAS
jgi:UDP-N-acetylglucosamine--N-acetylmuramyl-(pentapeptide) pyrophosphoryl-undecaprenol N-acetylglucosamine transferase